MYNEPMGEVAILYLEERPAADEGPFLREERALLDALAERIGSAAMRISAELELQESNRQLRLERKALQESNVALRAVLARIEEEKKEIYIDVQENVDKVLLPILHELAFHLPKTKRQYAEILRNNLEDITSPFVSDLSKNHLSFSNPGCISRNNQPPPGTYPPQAQDYQQRHQPYDIFAIEQVEEGLKTAGQILKFYL